MSDSIFDRALRMISQVGSELEKVTEKKKQAEAKNSETVEILTADKLRQLKWMSARQLGVIYGYGKRNVRIADDKEAYRQLMWMDAGQLEAIFGQDPRGEDN